MKGKLLVMLIGLFFLSLLSVMAEAGPGGLLECTNSLNTCTTNLGACINNLNVCTNSLGACTTGLAQAQTNMATCQANITQCGQTLASPSWYQKLPCDSTSNCPRFEVLADWNNEAVLDKETGLVWEKTPINWCPSSWCPTWYAAQGHCSALRTGSRMGWRLPTYEELGSLIDPTRQNPSLPPGHPFIINLQSGFGAWSATTADWNTSVAYNMEFVSGAPGDAVKSLNGHNAWCVRGGQGLNPQ